MNTMQLGLEFFLNWFAGGRISAGISTATKTNIERKKHKFVANLKLVRLDQTRNGIDIEMIQPYISLHIK